MAIEITYHGKYLPQLSASTDRIEALPSQVDEGVALADGAAAHNFEQAGLIRIVATSDCRVVIGMADDLPAHGERWFAGQEGVRFVLFGQAIKAVAL